MGTGIGHGQMEGKKLESLMFGFMNNEFDVLVSTTIVESGLDVPNANHSIKQEALYALEKLVKLQQQGFLTPLEFKQAKAKLLDDNN